MRLNSRTWITFFILSIVLSLNNIYSTLLTGWADGGSIIAVFLCLLFLPRKEGDILTYNLGQTMASAGGSVGFAVSIVASIYYSAKMQGNVFNPSLLKLSLLIVGLSLTGVALAVPFRRIIVHWFFPSAVACATILRNVTSEKKKDRARTQKIMGVSGLISGLITLPSKISLKEGGYPLLKSIPLSNSLNLSIDPLLYGIGILIGPRIGYTLLIGGIIHCYIIPLTEEYTRWIAVGFMTLPAFTSLLFSSFLKTTQPPPPGFHPKTIQETFTKNEKMMIGAIAFLGIFLTILMMKSLFDISWIYVVFAVAIAAPLCLTLGKVASDTDINPVRLLAIMLLFVFSLFENHNPIALLAIGIAGATFASLAVDLFYDLRTGYLIGANPKQQIFVQFLSVIPVSFASVFFLSTLSKKFGFGEGEYFPAPGIVLWSTMADAFAYGTQAVSVNVWIATAIASAIGVVMTFFENFRPTKSFAPSAFAMGISLLLPFEMSLAIFTGSIIRLITIQFSNHPKQTQEDAFQAGSAIFATSSLAGIVAVLLIAFGIAYLPKQ